MMVLMILGVSAFVKYGRRIPGKIKTVVSSQAKQGSI